jgi:imidazolonepropionase-like amidohydrolase
LIAPFLTAPLASPTAAGEGPAADLAVVGATILLGTGERIPDGVLLARAGRIEKVGPRASVEVPAGVPVVMGGGRILIPGLVDVWSDLPGGTAAGGQPDGRALDLVDPFAEGFRGLLAEGVTTAGVAPAPSRGVAGIGAVLKLRSARPRSLEEVVLRPDSHLVLALGMTAPGFGPPRITTAERLEQYYALRTRFTSAQEYGKGWTGYWEAVERYNKDLEKRLAAAAAAALSDSPARGPDDEKPPRPPRTELAKEALLRALDRKLPVLLVAHDKADLGYALRLKDEFGLDLTVLGAVEGWRAAPELARARTRVAVGPVLLTEWALELRGHRESNAAELSAAGVPVALTALGGDAFPGASLRLEACVAARGGLSPQAALAAVTLEPARALGLSDRVGTLEPGRDADLVLLDGEPTNALSRVLQVYVEGRLVFRREGEL